MYFEIFLENQYGDEFHVRGCIKPPATFTAREKFCQKVDDYDEFKEIEKCYCFSNECNGAGKTLMSLGAMFVGFILMSLVILWM